MNKQNKGITLIALVITIIVLVILVGVSVSVAINTGLIENSKTAVEDYDNAQKDEEREIEQLAWEINSQMGGTDLKMRDGILILNIDPSEATVGSIESFEDQLPDGYTIMDSEGNAIEESDKSTTYVSTGMTLVKEKGNLVVGKIAVIGDADESGWVDSDDSLFILNIIDGEKNTTAELNKKEYLRVAIDVNNDGKINKTDSYWIHQYDGGYAEKFPPEEKGYTGAASSIRIEKILRTTIVDWDGEDYYTVARLEETKLTNGETIGDINGNAIEESAKSTTYVSTGMTIIRNNEVVGRVAVIGAVDLSGDNLGNESIDIADVLFVNDVINGKRTVEEDYIKAAMDVNNDGKINFDDQSLLYDFARGIYDNDWDFEANEGEWPDEGFAGGASLIEIGE